MKVSINIPTYNQHEIIKNTVESAINQTYQNIEINVCDDSNNDLTEQVLEEYKSLPNFNYVKNSNNLGRVKNYHKLLYEISTGDWAVNLDGDDYFTDLNYIEEAVSLINKNKGLVMVCARHKALSPSLEITAVTSKYDKKKARDYYVFDGFKEFLPNVFEIGSGHLTSLYNRQLAIDIGAYNCDIITADSETVLRLVLHGKVGFVNKFVAVWRQHETNASQNSNIDEFISAFDCNDLVYNHGISLDLPKRELLKWKKMMDFRHTLRLFGRILYQNQPSYLDKFIEVIREKKISKVRLITSPEMVYKSLYFLKKYPSKFTKVVKIFFGS